MILHLDHPEENGIRDWAFIFLVSLLENIFSVSCYSMVGIKIRNNLGKSLREHRVKFIHFYLSIVNESFINILICLRGNKIPDQWTLPSLPCCLLWGTLMINHITEWAMSNTAFTHSFTHFQPVVSEWYFPFLILLESVSFFTEHSHSTGLSEYLLSKWRLHNFT